MFSNLLVGPMVYGVCYCPISLKEDIIKMGLAGGYSTLLRNVLEKYLYCSYTMRKLFFLVRHNIVSNYKKKYISKFIKNNTKV